MSKNRGIWLTIVCILLVGFAVTFATSSFIKRNRSAFDEAASSTMEGGERNVFGENEGLPGASEDRSLLSNDGDAKDRGDAAHSQDAVADRGKQAVLGRERALGSDAQASAQQQAVEEGANTDIQTEVEPVEEPSVVLFAEPDAANESLSSAPVSPMEAAEESIASGGKLALRSGSAGAGEPQPAQGVLSPLNPGNSMPVSLKETESAKEYYEKHLAEVDAQISKMRSDASDSSAYTMKTLAEKELQLWNTELTALYDAIASALDGEAKQALEKSQKDWMKIRDTKAGETAKKHSGGSLEGVEYTASLADSTRTRAYDLVEEYGDVLSSEGQAGSWILIEEDAV